MKQFSLALMVFCLAAAGSAQTHLATPKTASINNNCGGYYEFLPVGYSNAANAAIRYPLLIDVQGTGSEGDGSEAELAKLLKYGAAYYITQNKFPQRFEANGQSHSLIVISAQFKERGAGSDIDALIDFLAGKYRIDTNRIYLSGFSGGGEPVWRYPCLGASHSSTIAAMVPVAGVNTNRSYTGIHHIATAALPVWALHSKDDEVGMTPMENSVNFVNKINELDPAVPAIFTMLTGSHGETWSKVFDPAMRYDINGKQLNIYEWMLQYNRVASLLPVKLTSYNISLLNGQEVTVQWQTAMEHNNDFFIIERSMNGERFETIAQIPGNSHNGNGAAYTWIDRSPMRGKSWYRLLQVDKSGEKYYFEIKEILMEDQMPGVSIFPTLVQDNTFNITLPGGGSGPASFRVVNMNGAIVHSSNVQAGGNSTLRLTMQKWLPGLHIVEVKWNGNTEMVKIMKL